MLIYFEIISSIRILNHSKILQNKIRRYIALGTSSVTNIVTRGGGLQITTLLHTQKLNFDYL